MALTTARRIWAAAYPGKGYGPYEVHYSSSRSVRVCSNKLGARSCETTDDGSNPVVPGTGYALRCTYDPHDWICMQIRE